jgi:hypothetical protein
MIVMSYCLKCKIEYPEGRLTCPVCGNKLESNPPCESDLPQQTVSDNIEAFLVTVNEGFPAKMIEGSLRSAGIPFIKKGHSGSVGFTRFDTKYGSLGADFYVPPSELERAKSLLPIIDGVSDEITDGLSEDAENINEVENTSGDVADFEKTPVDLTDYNYKQDDDLPRLSRSKRIFSTLGFLLLIVIVIFGVDYVMNIIRSMLGYN